MICHAFFLKTVSRLLAEYCDVDFQNNKLRHDAVLGCSVTTLDLGQIFWSMVLDQNRLRVLLEHDAPEISQITHEVDSLAIQELPHAKAILGKFAQRLPDADELWFSFRVISRCVGIICRSGTGYQVHLTRGLIPDTYNPYRLDDILDAAVNPTGTPIGCLLEEFLQGLHVDAKRPIFIICIRNDGELHQAILLAAILKRRLKGAIVVVETTNANEQYDFESWIDLFNEKQREMALYLDYFIPRQDYRNALGKLIKFLQNGQPLPIDARLNLFEFEKGSLDRPARSAAMRCMGEERFTLSRAQRAKAYAAIEKCFIDHLRHASVFLCAGQRTLATRLSPYRCHWASCNFCTINSQHILPRANTAFDDKARRYVSILIDVIRSKRVESIILMDEALPTAVLFGFAKELLAHEIQVVYRVRARFSDRLDLDGCRLLYASGCRYLGLGLEAASLRVNRMANKLDGVTPDYERIINNLETAGIRSHVYSIMGFPTETTEEIHQTYEFLSHNIEKHPYFTVSANPFYLMKGSVMAREPGRFGITRVEADDVSLTFRFEELECLNNGSYMRKCVKSLNQKMFLPNADDKEATESFWYFLDQTGIFYVQKVKCRTNPFRALATFVQRPLPGGGLDQTFSRSNYLFEIDSASTDTEHLICDWVTNNYARVPQYLYDFIFSFSDTLTLRDNMDQLVPPAYKKLLEADFRRLVQLGFFTHPRHRRNNTNITTLSQRHHPSRSGLINEICKSQRRDN